MQMWILAKILESICQNVLLDVPWLLKKKDWAMDQSRKAPGALRKEQSVIWSVLEGLASILGSLI